TRSSATTSAISATTPSPLRPRSRSWRASAHSPRRQKRAPRRRGEMHGEMQASGRLSENVMHFARLLRAAGLRVGSDRVIDCVRALEIAGQREFPLRREDWYWTMSAVLLSRQEQRPIFDQAFRLFWRDPKLAERMMSLMLPQAYGRAGKPEQQQSQRLTDALFSKKEDAPETEKLELEARLTFSSREVLSRMDFDTMSAAE